MYVLFAQWHCDVRWCWLWDKWAHPEDEVEKEEQELHTFHSPLNAHGWRGSSSWEEEVVEEEEEKDKHMSTYIQLHKNMTISCKGSGDRGRYMSDILIYFICVIAVI